MLAALLPFVYCALSWRSETFSAAGRVPIGYDAFFHARLALQWASGHPVAFDTSIHAPEGSWLVWPWAWDAALGAAVWTSRHLGLDSLELAMALPVLVGVVNLLLVARLLSRLGLNSAWCALAALGVGLAPTFVQNHAFGAIDHHAAELSFVLLTLNLAADLHRDATARRAGALGALLGFSHALHPGLFVWHLPLAFAFGTSWLTGRAVPPNIAVACAVGIAVGLAAAVLPADSVHAGLFQFDVFSLFHVYVSLITAGGLVAIARIAPRPSAKLIVACVAAVAALPLLIEARDGLRWLSGDLEFFNHLVETASPMEFVASRGIGPALRFYGPAVLFGTIALGWWIVSQRLAARGGLMVTAMFVLIVLLGASQVRYAYLWVPAAWMAAIAGLECVHRHVSRPLRALAWSGLVVALLVPLPMTLSKPGIGGDRLFASSQAFWPQLGQICATGSPVLLAEPVFGHFINYFSACRTVANNFVSNSLHESKIREAYALLGGPPEQIAQAAPFVGLVLVRAGPIGIDTAGCTDRSLNTRLICDDETPGFRRLVEVRATLKDGSSRRLLGLFAVERGRDEARDAASGGD